LRERLSNRDEQILAGTLHLTHDHLHLRHGLPFLRGDQNGNHRTNAARFQAGFLVALGFDSSGTVEESTSPSEPCDRASVALPVFP